MATAVETKVKPDVGERRFVIYDVGWDGYQTLLTLIGDRSIRLTYDRGNVELMSPLLVHERYKWRLGRTVETVADELLIPIICAGATTFRREDLDRGLEPDECYYITNREWIGAKKRVDLTIDPPPDLAIEVEITRSALGRLGIYANLGVPEVWRFDGEVLTVLLLGAEGTYSPSGTSAAFPFLPMGDIERLIQEGDMTDDLRWGREFRAWFRAEVAPRVQGAGE